MATLNVNSVAGFNAAINSAHAGDVIALAAGTYSNILIANHTYSGGVTITSQDLTHPASLIGLGVANSSNLTFSNLDMTIVGTTDPYYGFRIDNSQNITLSNLTVHGDPSVVAYNQKAAFYITYSTGVNIENSTFEHMGQALTVNNDSNVDISNNTFAYLSKGGIEMGGTSNVSIDHNTIEDFQVSQGTHPDGIQIYTAGFTASAHDISITNNLIDRGNGDAIQGIFVQDETGVLPFFNVNIQNNTVLGGMWDSLYLNDAQGTVTIANNYVASWAGVDQEGNGIDGAAGAAATVTGFAGYIWLQNVSNATLTEYGNTAQSYLGQAGTPIAPPTGNTWIGQVNPQTALTSPLSAVTAVAQTFTGNTFGAVTGNVLTGDTGNGVFLESVYGNYGSSLVSTGTTFQGAYGTLKISSDGSFVYTTSVNPVIGVSYDDKFTLTVGSTGQATSTSLDIILTSTGVGDGQADVITGGAAASRFTNFGTGSLLTSGVGADTFVFSNVSQSTLANETVIKGFKAGDLLDFSGINPNLKVVSQFDGHAGEIVLAHMGTGNWQVQVDTNGDGYADFAVHVVNTSVDLSAASFANLGSASTVTSAPVTTTPVTTTVATTPATTSAATTSGTGSTAAATPGVVVGDGQADHLAGGASATTLSGFGTGSLLTNGVGADTFVFSSASQSTLANETVINGFKAGDKIDFSAINPNFKIVSQFDGHAGEIMLAHMGSGNWQVEADTNGDGYADFAVHVVNTSIDLSAASFNFTPSSTSSSTAATATAAATSAATAAATAAATTANLAAATAAANASAAASAAAASAAAATAAAAAPVTVAQTASLLEHATVTGNALTGDTGTGLSLVSVGIGTDPQRAVAAGGTTFVGQHGSLTINPDGSYAYVELRDALTAGTVWDDHFTITVAAANGKQTSTTLDFMVTGSPTGNGGVNYITGGAAATSISGFGAGSQLTSGVGADTFVFNSIGQSTLANETLIKGFKSGDIIDLSAIDPAFQIVSRFDGHAHELMLAHIGNGNWQVEGDTTGLGAPTFAIHVFTAASANLSAASFHL
jgi:VCBS repeat-containing protein